MRPRPGLLAVLLSLAVLFSAPAARAEEPVAGAGSLVHGKELVVATRIVPPLVVTGADNAALSGFSIELWQAIARQAGLKFHFIVKDKLSDLLDSVRFGEADVAVAAISINADREAVFDFSQPMLESGLQIMVPLGKSTSPHLGGFIDLVTSPGFVELLVVFLILIVLPAPLVAFFESRHPRGIVGAGKHRRGWLKAAWWSATTLLGQSEEKPRSAGGRCVAIIWMMAGVLFVSYFTATAATMMTVRQLDGGIHGPADLRGKRVGSVAGTSAALFLRETAVRTISYGDIGGAIAALENGALDAVVYDAPVLQYHAAHAGQGKVRLVDPVFHNEDYGVLMPLGSALRKPVNSALLRLREDGTYAAIYTKWLGAAVH